MKHADFARVALVAVCSLLLGGCSKKTDAKTELEKASAVLAQTENAQPTPAAEPQPQAQPAAVETSSTEPPPVVVVSPSQQMQQALVYYKAGQLEDAVTRLQKLRATPTLTAQQRMAVQESVAAVMNEVYQMAAKGDSRAIAAVRQYEQMQTAPRP